MKKISGKRIREQLEKETAIYNNLKAFKKKYCGKRLGWGETRQVYEYKPDPAHWVLKIEHGVYTTRNIFEWEIWQHVRWYNGPNKPIKDAFAPCGMLMLMSTRTVLLMERAAMSTEKKKFPRRVYNFLGDIKMCNFGWIAGRFVCVDYGNVFDRVLALSLTRKKRKILSWDEKESDTEGIY